MECRSPTHSSLADSPVSLCCDPCAGACTYSRRSGYQGDHRHLETWCCLLLLLTVCHHPPPAAMARHSHLLAFVQLQGVGRTGASTRRLT